MQASSSATTTTTAKATSAKLTPKTKAHSTPIPLVSTISSVDPNSEIEEISKKISEHADAIYRTWKCRGLAPTELLELYTSEVEQTQSGVAAVNEFLAAADDTTSTEGLHKLVNNFVIKDKEQRGAKFIQSKSASGATTINSHTEKMVKQIKPATNQKISTSTSSTVASIATSLKSEKVISKSGIIDCNKGETTSKTIAKVAAPSPIASPLVTQTQSQTPLANVVVKSNNACVKNGENTQSRRRSPSPKAEHKTEMPKSSLYQKNLNANKSNTIVDGNSNALKTPTTSVVTKSPALDVNLNINPLDGKRTPGLDLKLDVQNLSELQAQNLLKIKELLEENTESVKTKRKTVSKKSEDGKLSTTKSLVNKTADSTASRTTSTDSNSANLNSRTGSNSIKKSINVIENSKSNKTLSQTDAVDASQAKPSSVKSVTSVAAVTSNSPAIIQSTDTKSVRKQKTNAEKPNANVENAQKQSSSQQEQQNCSTSNKTKDNEKVSKSVTKSVKSNQSAKSINVTTSATTTTNAPNIVTATKERKDTIKSATATATASVSASATATATVNANATVGAENGMEVARSMPTLTKFKSGSRSSLANGPDKNLGRPILTRGSVAERVLLFEKCPDARNSFLNIKRPDPADAPPKSLLKVKLHATPPPPPDQNSVQKEFRTNKSVYIPRFYFPHGKPQPQIAAERTLRNILSAFDSFPNNQVTKDELPRILKLCGIPYYWRMPIMIFCQQNSSGLVERQRFVEFWKQMNVYCHEAASRFIYILSRGQRFRNYIVPDDLVPLVQDVVDTHPGLAFLKEATEFHSRYVHTVIARIFYSVNRSWSGKITLAELKRSDLMEIISLLEEEDDINQIMAFFSYEHFYVIYCKFWELDKDHDLLINQDDLARYSDHALSTRIVERIFSGCVTRNDNKKGTENEPKMSYTDFVWFLLSEEDKRTPTAIEYWFRCMDIDGDGLLSMYELEYFYEEQQHRMESIGIETLPFEDCLCQMLDMLKPARRDCISLGDLKRCKMTHVFFDTFFNLEKYLDHEQRDPFASQRDEFSSDWERFAAQEYELLITEEND